MRYNRIFRKIKRIKDIYNNIAIINRGYKVYSSLKQEYGIDCKIYVGQHPGTGDVYLQSMFINGYAKQNNVDNYVFTIIGGSAKSITKLFNIKIVKVLSLYESNCLVSFYRFMGEYCNIEVLHYHPMMMHYGVLGYVRNYKGLNFYKMMHKYVFKSVSPSAIEIPIYSQDDKYIITLFKKNHLKFGKTVLLAPTANSLYNLPNSFWEKLVFLLNKKGYTVCTNSAGYNEKTIMGSIPIFIPYKYLKIFMENAGYIISLRSGLTDIISGLECKKIIIYPKQDIYSIMGGLGSSYEYFSLNKMGLCNDAIEYEIDINNEKEMKLLLRKILCKFEKS